MSYFFPLLRREEIAEKTVALWLGRPKGFEFKAGQNVDINSICSFSISSSPSDREAIRIAFRVSESEPKQELLKIPLGTKVKVDGPFGDFVLPKKSDRPIVFLAGGIG